MSNYSKEKELYLSMSEKLSGVLDDNDAKEIFDALKNGKSSYLRLDRIESSSFDNSWIENIESCLFDLGTIINNPRMVTKTTADLTPIELAKKTNSTSIMHLASHTQYIKDIDENGNVIPNKILSIGSDDDIKTYENRFIATLIRKLVLFVEKRYEFVKQYATLMDHEQLFFKNSSNLNGAKVNIETKIVVDSPKEEKIEIETNDYIKRIEQVREYILYYYNSRFMKIFKTDKNVKNPILQTNIIRKNPKYHRCYELYRFIEAYDKLGVNYSVKEEYQDFDTNDLNRMNLLTFYNFLSLQGKDKEGRKEEKETHYDPIILTSSDDEEFVYGPLLKGPISFVRTDKDYQTYLDSKTDANLPPHPSHREKAYFQDEYRKRLMSKQEYKQKEFLLERKSKNALLFDEEVKKRIRKMEEELEFLKEKRMKKRHEEEEEYLRKFRSLLADDARKFQIDSHDWGVYLSNEEYHDLKNGIGLSTTIDNAPLPKEESVEEIKAGEKEDIPSTLLEEETLPSSLSQEISSTLLSVENIEDEEIIPVKVEMDILKPEEKKEEPKEQDNQIRILSSMVEDYVPSQETYCFMKQESEQEKLMRKVQEEEKDRLLNEYEKLLEEEKEKNRQLKKKLSERKDDSYLPKILKNPTNLTDDMDLISGGFIQADRKYRDRKHATYSKGNGYLEETIRKDASYQSSETIEKKSRNQTTSTKGGYLSEVIKKDPIYRKSDENKMDYESIKKEKSRTKKKKNAAGNKSGSFREFGK